MKLLIISDIHSNSYYLNRIKDYIEGEKADVIYFIGDAIGIYDDPNSVLNWLKSINAICIKGNHEKYFLDEIKYKPEMEGIYLVREHRAKISDENTEFIKSWSDKIEATIQDKSFLFVHGDINSSENHIYTPSIELDDNILKKYDYYIYGNTHIPLIQYHYGCCIINPGSIGQPRDYTATPSYVVINLDLGETVIRKIPVKPDDYIKHLEGKLFNKEVINILKRKVNEKN